MAGVATAVKRVQECELLVVASPTFKASYTGVLKCFLDQFPSGGLAGVTAFPVMLGAGPGHAMAPEQMLRQPSRVLDLYLHGGFLYPI